MKYSGDWTGRVAEMMPEAFKGYPLTRFAYNAVAIPTYNFAPPVLPMAERINAWINSRIPTVVATRLKECFGGEVRVRFVELASEEFAGLGLGVSALIGISLVARIGGMLKRAQEGKLKGPWYKGEGSTFQTFVAVCPYLALGVLMAKGGWPYPVRYLAPYYPLLFPILLAGPEQTKLVAARWWHNLGLATFFLAGVLVVLSPARPLLPMKWFLERIHTAQPNHLTARALRVYTIYSQRSDAFKPVRGLLPPETKVLGLVTWGDPEASLWMPFGSRRILHVCAGDTGAELRAKGIQFVLVKELAFNWPFQSRGPNWPFDGTLASWVARQQGEIMGTLELDFKASGAPEKWFLVRLK
ncbi:MAG: hypothetical protein NZ739_03845 [Verrucomicrobiae bacterium]|nr:hypothetical protein [Verrucomicrobiae bacterium]